MSTQITLESGNLAQFWHDRWLHGLIPKKVASRLFSIAARKNRTVREAMQNDKWFQDLTAGLTVDMRAELIELSGHLDRIVLTEVHSDDISWRFTPDGAYTAKLAYDIQFVGSSSMEAANVLWFSWAPGKCRFFLWTAALESPTADHLQRKGWVNNYFCALYIRNLETPLHLLVECPWARQVWDQIALQANTLYLQPESWAAASNIKEWMSSRWDSAPKEKKKATISMIHLIAWEIWKERNMRVFQHQELAIDPFIRRVTEEINLWNLAGAFLLIRAEFSFFFFHSIRPFLVLCPFGSSLVLSPC